MFYDEECLFGTVCSQIAFGLFATPKLGIRGEETPEEKRNLVLILLAYRFPKLMQLVCDINLALLWHNSRMLD